MIRVIREEIGFQGLLMSDDLNMQALAGDACRADGADHCGGGGYRTCTARATWPRCRRLPVRRGRMGEATLRRGRGRRWRRGEPVAVDVLRLLLAELADG